LEDAVLIGYGERDRRAVEQGAKPPSAELQSALRHILGAGQGDQVVLGKPQTGATTTGGRVDLQKQVVAGRRFGRGDRRLRPGRATGCYACMSFRRARWPKCAR